MNDERVALWPVFAFVHSCGLIDAVREPHNSYGVKNCSFVAHVTPFRDEAADHIINTERLGNQCFIALKGARVSVFIEVLYIRPLRLPQSRPSLLFL